MRITIASIILIISATAIGAEDTPSHFDIPEQVLNNITKESRNKLQDIIAKAQHGDKASQTVMGLIYLNGLSESPSVKDINKAFYWLNLAAKQNYDEAEFYLGQIYHTDMIIRGLTIVLRYTGMRKRQKKGMNKLK